METNLRSKATSRRKIRKIINKLIEILNTRIEKSLPTLSNKQLNNLRKEIFLSCEPKENKVPNLEQWKNNYLSHNLNLMLIKEIIKRDELLENNPPKNKSKKFKPKFKD